MQFLFVGSNVCRQLPSDSTSQWTPLLLANTPYCKAYSGLAPYSVVCMPDAQKKQITKAICFTSMSERPGSNRPPRPWQGRALPNELLSHNKRTIVLNKP